MFQFKLVVVKTISWGHDAEAPKETLTLEYGGLVMQYGQQSPNGQVSTVFPGGWNRVKNTAETDSNTVIS